MLALSLWPVRLQSAPTGSTLPGVEAWFAENVPGAEPPLRFERIAGGHSNLTYRVTDSGGRSWALRRPPLGKRLGSAHDMAREHRVVSALAATPVPVAPVVGLCEEEDVNGAPFYVMEFVEGPVLRGLAEAEAFPDHDDRRAIAERVVDTLVDDPRRRPGRRRPRRARPQGGLRGPPAASLAGPVGEVEDARAAARRRGPRPACGGGPRAGPGDDRPRRLPARQHDPHPGRRGGRGRRLGALHARRPAGRRRPADGLLAARRRGGDLARPAGQPRARLSRPRRLRERYAERSGRDLSRLDFYVALGYWKLAIILEGVYARYAAGGYGKVDEGVEYFARVVESLAEAADRAAAGG